MTDNSSNNPTIQRLDRRAGQVGLALEKPSPNVRRFAIGERVLTYRPGGKGVVRVEAVGGELCDSEVTAATERIERYFIMAIESARENDDA